MSDSFQTVGAPLEHEPDKVKGSRHIANVFPVTSHQEIDSCIKSVRARMPDANHHAYAWRLGRGDNDFRYSDDGEPSGSAGRPSPAAVKMTRLAIQRTSKRQGD